MRWREYAKVPGVLSQSPLVSVWDPKIHYVSLPLKLFCSFIFCKWRQPRETLLNWCPPMAISGKILDSENTVCNIQCCIHENPTWKLKPWQQWKLKWKILTISCSNPTNISPWSCSKRSRCHIWSTNAMLFLWSYLNFREFRERNFETCKLNGDLNVNDALNSKRVHCACLSNGHVTDLFIDTVFKALGYWFLRMKNVLRYVQEMPVLYAYLSMKIKNVW